MISLLKVLLDSAQIFVYYLLCLKKSVTIQNPRCLQSSPPAAANKIKLPESVKVIR